MTDSKTTDTTAKTRKPRMKAIYTVYLSPENEIAGAGVFDSHDQALAWIKANGKDGQAYAVLCQTRPAVTVSRKTVEKVSLT